MPRYWLDANVLIEAHKRSYPFDIAKTFWLRLAEQIELGHVVSARRVFQEVAEDPNHQDAVANFVKTRRQYLCLRPSQDVTQAVGHVSQYVFSNYINAEAWRFSKGADPWVIAHALVDSGVVVTQESALHPEARVVRIPDVCQQFHVQCVNTLEMFRRLGVTF